MLIISSPQDLPAFERLLGNGPRWGLSFEYAEQTEPRGLADAFIVGEKFIGDDSVSLILGDNIFFGSDLPKVLRKAVTFKGGATIFAYQVRDPERSGVVEFDENGKVISIEEKPKAPRSNFAIPGLYFYDNRVVSFAKSLTPSSRGEIEITDLNKIYLELDQLYVQQLGRGIAWLDAGKHESLLQAANFVQAVEERQGMMISCPEEIAYRMNFISLDDFNHLAKSYPNSYGEYLLRLVEQERK